MIEGAKKDSKQFARQIALTDLNQKGTETGAAH
jgi:hypothetical protein